MCAQSVFKLHPRFDAAVRGVLEASVSNHVVFTEGRDPRWTASFRERLRSNVGDQLMARVRENNTHTYITPLHWETDYCCTAAGHDIQGLGVYCRNQQCLCMHTYVRASTQGHITGGDARCCIHIMVGRWGGRGGLNVCRRRKSLRFFGKSRFGGRKACDSTPLSYRPVLTVFIRYTHTYRTCFVRDLLRKRSCEYIVGP